MSPGFAGMGQAGGQGGLTSDVSHTGRWSEHFGCVRTSDAKDTLCLPSQNFLKIQNQAITAPFLKAVQWPHICMLDVHPQPAQEGFVKERPEPAVPP